MDEILAKLNSTLIDIRLVSEDTRKAVNDTFNSGVQEIEYFKYSTEVNSKQTPFSNTDADVTSLTVEFDFMD